MKKLSFIILFLITFVFSADVKPFYFENIPDSVQQESWEILMKYKTFGANELSFGNKSIRITDKSGWIGTSKGNFNLGQNGEDTLGGPIIVGGNLTFNNGPDIFTTGPINVYGNIYVTQDGFKNSNNEFSGYQCVKGTVDSIYAKFVPSEYQFFGENYENCPIKDTHPNDTSLMIPVLMNDTAVYHSIMYFDSTLTNDNIDNKTATINIPTGSYKDPYDLYIKKISFSNAGKLVIRQQQGGRLTRIFLEDGITFSSFTKIVVAYCDSLNNCNELENTDYSGTLLFYTTKDIEFPSFDKSTSLQGSFISYGKISIAHHLVLAGQILANNLSIDTDFDGSTFLYVPFDPPVLSFDPTALASGKFIENDIPTKINIHLDTAAKTDVLFDYCFIFNDSVTIDDFNEIIPVCGENINTGIIKAGTTTLINDIYLNVKLDGITESDEKFALKIFNLQGAVLPGNVHSGYFYLTLTDGVIVNNAPIIDKIDTIKNYQEALYIPPSTGYVGHVHVIDEDTTKLLFEINDTTGLFEIDNNGNIYTKHVFDYETEDTLYHVMIKVSDQEFIDSAIYVIKIGNVQENIALSSKLDSISEFAIIGDTIGFVIGKDADSTQVTYTISDNTFKIDSNGVITVNKTLDYEVKSKYIVTIKAKSIDGSKKDTTVIIKVYNENEPIHVNDTTFTIDENLKDTVLGKVIAYDEDNDTIYYSISDTINYSITDGTLILKNYLDYETITSDTIKVYVTDNHGSTDSAIIVININNVNEPLHIDSVMVTIDENLPIATVIDTIHGYDEDGDTIVYIPITPDIIIKDSIIYLNREVDFEKDTLIIVKVIASTNDDKDTISIKIKINNINEPVHVKDTTFVIPENQIGIIGTVNAWDEDNDTIYYSISDTSKFAIDSITGNIYIKIPYDYESQTYDSVIVYVTDKHGMTDSALIKINVNNEIENSVVNIISTVTKDTIWHNDSVFTNRPNISINWKADSIYKITDTTVTPGVNVIALCYKDSKKDNKSCDTVTIFYSEAAPIVTIAKVEVHSEAINGVTIVEETDSSDSNIYVNTKINDIEVTVKDTVTGESEQFKIQVELDTLKIASKYFEEYNYIPTTDTSKLKVEFTNNKIKYTETIIVHDDTIYAYYYGDDTGNPLDTVSYIEYTKKINGKTVTFTYAINDLGIPVSNYEVKYDYTDKEGNIVSVSYTSDKNGDIKKNSDSGIGYKISYTYTNKYGNTGTASVFIALNIIPPKVEIKAPIENETYYTNSIKVIWTVDGITQDTLNLERLEEGINNIIRMYKDKYGNIGADTVIVFLKNAKDIDIKVINPVTEINMDKVEEYYWKGNTYNQTKPINIMIHDPSADSLPKPIGVGLKVTIVLPNVSPTKGLATIDDMVQVINGKSGILVDKNGNLKAGTSTGADGSYVIPVDKYIDEHCNDEYKNEFRKNGLDHTTIWGVTYSMHIWIFTNTGNYVNDFNFDYTMNDTEEADDAGILTMVIDWLADKDGYVKSVEGKAISTGAYLTKLEAKSIAKTRCDLPNQPIGTKVKKSENDLTSFGYKRPKQ